MHFFFLLQTAFSLWMLVDAVQRGARYYWLWIIMMPFGELAYFLAVKIHDPPFRRLKQRYAERPATLKELRYAASRSPSIQNRLLLAQALHDKQEYSEAAELFREIIASDCAEKRALYGLGRCLLETKQTREAVEAMQDLVQRDFEYEDFQPVECLAQLYWESGEREKAVELMRKTVRKSQRLRHILQLAHYLRHEEQHGSAREMLREALEDHENAPKYVRRAERAWAKKARSILRELPAD